MKKERNDIEEYPEEVEDDNEEKELKLKFLVRDYPFYQGVDRINKMFEELKDKDERKKKIEREIEKFERFLSNYNPIREEKMKVIFRLVEMYNHCL